jgi:hypothetical protein
MGVCSGALRNILLTYIVRLLDKCNTVLQNARYVHKKTNTDCVYCGVRSGSLNIISSNVYL